ncbi:MAG: hypothetical protein M3Q29_23495 [Chloroflexota bacterium]|nr:hypothetical protein [Chloroflexota bacterium]
MAVQNRLDDRRWKVLGYLYKARQYDVPVVGRRISLEGRERLSIYSQTTNGALEDLPQVSAPVVEQLASDGYLDLSRPDPAGPYSLRITDKGVEAVQSRQRRLMQAIYDHFREAGEWPKYRELGRRLVGQMRVEDVAKSLPPGYINEGSAGDASYDHGDNGAFAMLTVPAISLCEGSDGDLSDFMRVLRLCLNRHADNTDPTPKISRDDLTSELGMSELTVRKMIRLLGGEYNISADGGGDVDDPSWFRNISDDIRLYEGVESIHDYLDLRPIPYYTGLPRRPYGYPLTTPGVANPPSAHRVVGVPQPNRLMPVNPLFQGRDFALDASKAFVLSPFGGDFDAIYRDHIKKAVESIGVHCRRADDFYDNSSIIEDIWRAINEAGIVISDLTGRNPNVFYETGIAHTLGKEVILLTQSSEDVPFDVRHIRYIRYAYTPPGMTKLEEVIKETIQTILPRLHPETADKSAKGG